ncbi:hypothetical protein Pyn_10332 [Prunus yedoensis var. nudiflora]|uniref:Uncharacterized protein n=1 Tax=Prunus yedoensis var. nudiflora TaxID=2094558 RepID=A0A314YFZ3_PRUYE|nr:hypothetical protein Pyn_10332 [Prunus yedoensis var. nudiflora]
MAWEAAIGGDASSGCPGNSPNRVDVATILEPADHDMIDMEMSLQNSIRIEEVGNAIMEKIINGTHKMKAAETKAFKEDVDIKTVAARFKVALDEDVHESLQIIHAHIPTNNIASGLGSSRLANSIIGAKKNVESGFEFETKKLVDPMQYEVYTGEKK